MDELEGLGRFREVRPPSVDRTHMTASRCFCGTSAPGVNSNWRQVTNTIPVLVTAMSQFWLPWTPSEMRWIRNVRPPSVDVASSIALLPLPVKRAQQT